MLGPILFLMYTFDLVALVEKHGLHPHLYADDTHLYDDHQTRMSACIDCVANWMLSNRLQLNTSKTDVLWCSTAHRQHQLPCSATRVGSDHVVPSTCVCDLGFAVDADQSMRSHVQRTAAGCIAVLRQLRSIGRSGPSTEYQSFIAALVLPRLDYANATLADMPACQLRRLQSVLNAAARSSLTGLRRNDHITDALIKLHWLRVAERINFKLATLVYRSLHGMAPTYLSDDLYIVLLMFHHGPS